MADFAVMYECKIDPQQALLPRVMSLCRMQAYIFFLVLRSLPRGLYISLQFREKDKMSDWGSACDHDSSPVAADLDGAAGSGRGHDVLPESGRYFPRVQMIVVAARTVTPVLRLHPKGGSSR